ncbi:MAG TPA: UvrD-helicase domain-containing protein [Candidatus Binatia bacterium]|nr:UvrD-helicase domain-containing protein [Candidatus Binatia bacterium]
MTHPLVDAELGLLAAVLERLDTTTTAAPPSEVSLVRELEHLRDSIRSAKEEDRPALVQQWDRQSALLRQLRTADRPTAVDAGSPYFAHLRLRERDAEHDILLGNTTRMLPGLPIVDWRNAPISRIFYRYRQGEEYEEEIAGRTKSGEVVARRTVTIRDRSLLRVAAPEGIFEVDAASADGWRQSALEPSRLAGGQGAALRAHDTDAGRNRRLGTDVQGERRRADKHLPAIAGLIDPAQFDLITRPSSGFVLIRGTAGSGKTTVALHRIAYLAYEDPRIDSPDTLFLVFSPALRQYVGHVLPALGVSRVQVKTFHEWAVEQVRRVLPALPRAVRELTPAGVHRLKLHPAMVTALADQVRRVPGKPTPAQVVDDWASVLMDRAFLTQIFDREAPGDFSAAELDRATDWNRKRYEELRSWLSGDTSVDAELDAEDAALLLLTWQLRVGPLPGRGQGRLRYRHVAIDEVQDLSPLEVRVLLDCLDQNRSLTLAGDTQQHIVAGGGFTSWAEFLRRLGLQGQEVSTLDVSYRCTHEIATFALGLLGDLREDDTPPRTVRSGPAVELFRFTDHGATVAFLADALGELMTKEPLASVAVLTPSPDLSALYARGLISSEVPKLRLVENQDFTFAPGVEVTEIEQVKGLEFDYVVLIEVSTGQFPDTAESRRRLHVGATRAVHQLWLTSVGTPSAPVRAQLALSV